MAQPLRFLIVGVGGYVVNLGIFEALHRVGTQYVVAAVISYLASNALMYIGNRYFTFRLGHDGFWAAYLRYMAVGLLVVVLITLVLAALVEGAGIDATLGNGIALLVVMPFAFVLFKRWTFRA